MLLRREITSRCFQFLAMGLLTISLAGCFKPMLAEQPSGSSVTASLANVYVETVIGRVGQRLRNKLIYFFSGAAQSEASAYRLSISLTETVSSGLVQPDTNALAKTVKLKARFTLTDTATGKPIHGGESFARATFDRKVSTAGGTSILFANERAELDAQNRAADTLAEDIRARIAGYFAAK